MSFVRRIVLVALAAGGLGLVSACSVPDPRISFFADGTTVSAMPIQYCDIQEQNCRANGGAPVSLAVRDDRPVQISAPAEVARSPWQVAARYRGRDGGEFVACSPLFAAGSRFAYTVNSPRSGAALVLIEVYQASGTLIETPDGEVQTPIRGTWVLTAANTAEQVLPKPGDNLCTQ